MALRISRLLLTGLADAARASGAEICGLLAGEGELITQAIAARNVAVDPARRFEIDPVTLFDTLRADRRGELALIGCYHSHPGGDPSPSARDAADAAPDGKLWLIIGADAVGLWRAVERGARFDRFDAVPFAIMPPAGLREAQGFVTRPGEPHIRSLDA